MHLRQRFLTVNWCHDNDNEVGIRFKILKTSTLREALGQLSEFHNTGLKRKSFHFITSSLTRHSKLSVLELEPGMAGEASPTTTKRLPLWLLSVLKLYAENRLLKDTMDSQRNLPSESDITEFEEFWQWIAEREENTEPAADLKESERVRSEMMNEAYEAAVERGLFGIHDRKWWVKEMGRLNAIRSEPTKLKKKSPERDTMQMMEEYDIRKGEDEQLVDDSAGSAVMRGVLPNAVENTNQDTPVLANLIEDLTDEGIEDISSDEELYGKDIRLQRLNHQPRGRDDSVIDLDGQSEIL